MKETITIYVYAAKYHAHSDYKVLASTVVILDRHFYDIQILDTIEYDAVFDPKKLEANYKEKEQSELFAKKARLQAELDELNAQLSK